MTHEEINLLVQRLARARNVRDYSKSALDAMEEELHSTGAYKAYMTSRTENAAEAADLESTLRKAQVEAYTYEQAKSIHPALSTRVKTEYIYDADEVKAACITNPALHGLLLLDTKSFEKVGEKLGMCQTRAVPQATIATDLTPYLDEPTHRPANVLT